MNVYDKFFRKLTNNRIVKILLIMVIIGSVLGIENSQTFGCIIGVHIFSISNYLFLFVSVALLLGIKKTKKLNIKIILCLIELAIWILKYFFYKGGYIAGFAGSPNFINVIYDFTAIGLRFMLLMSLFNKLKISIVPILLISLFLVAIKISFFALPWYTSYNWAKQEEYSEKQRIELIGYYKGEILNLDNDERLKIELQIDSTKIIFSNKTFIDIKEQYLLHINYPNIAELSSSESVMFEIQIERLDSDSLFLNIKDPFIEKYILKLERLNRSSTY